ncbi:MAG TPA: prephenate dehydratase [Candidatus Acidoferrales bacterium]|nr:prephenate dehydratase [Candidatus Acidoferrales bacterium]
MNNANVIQEMSTKGRIRRVAFQGERGAFSEEAAVLLLGEEIDAVPRPTFEALFSSVKEGVADYALAPIENSLAGSVHRSYDLLLESHLHVIAEVILPIAHNLIGLPKATFEQITSVESHPVALAQCERFFREHPQIRRVAALDTAGSVREIILGGDQPRAAIAGKRAAEIYGGRILREHIEDHPENFTRFLLLAAAPEPNERADKLSLVVHLEHKPGALKRALDAFAARNISLLKIESRPIPGHPWEYRFYLDLQAALNDTQTQRALDELRTCTTDVRILGCYPHASSKPEK